MMFDWLRRRVWGPADKVIAGVLGLCLLGGLGYGGFYLATHCDNGLKKADGECVGATTEAVEFGKGTPMDVVGKIAEENRSVREQWDGPEDGKKKRYVRIGLTMPYTADKSSATTPGMVKRSLQGAYLAQKRANRPAAGMNYQLVMANEGENLQEWEYAVEDLIGMAEDEESPLVAAIGFANSDTETKGAVNKLDEEGIPAIGSVLSSPDVKAGSLFKISPSNRDLVEALKRYLIQNPEGPGQSERDARQGYLAFDSRQNDVYVKNLEKLFHDNFDDTHDMDGQSGQYTGGNGPPVKKVTTRFDGIVTDVCTAEADTLFYAGRDADLPELVRRLEASPCAATEGKPLRIVRASTGLDPAITGDTLKKTMEKANISTVSGAAFDSRGWAKGGVRPDGFDDFKKDFEEEFKKGAHGEEALDDGYAAMHYDSFLTAAKATEDAYGDVIDKEEEGKEAGNRVAAGDVAESLGNMTLKRNGNDDLVCLGCVSGATGTIAFDTTDDNGNWPVCKPVPVIVYPAEGAPEDEGPHQTYEGKYKGKCPGLTEKQD